MTVRMQQVVASCLEMAVISNDNKLPNTCNKPVATRRGAQRISNDDHEEILDEIARREALEYEEEEEIESEEEDDQEEEESNDAGSVDSGS